MVLRRTAQLAAICALATVAALLILEVVGVIGQGWRLDLAATIEQVAAPSWPAWLSAVMGLGLAALGLSMVLSQLIPAKTGASTLHEVHRGEDGVTRIRGRAAIAAVRHQLEQVDGIDSVEARLRGRAVHVELIVDDGTDVGEVERQARERLDHGFWIELGLADLAVNLLITHDPAPPKVR